MFTRKIYFFTKHKKKLTESVFPLPLCKQKQCVFHNLDVKKNKLFSMLTIIPFVIFQENTCPSCGELSHPALMSVGRLTMFLYKFHMISIVHRQTYTHTYIHTYIHNFSNIDNIYLSVLWRTACMAARWNISARRTMFLYIFHMISIVHRQTYTHTYIISQI